MPIDLCCAKMNKIAEWHLNQFKTDLPEKTKRQISFFQDFSSKIFCAVVFLFFSLTSGAYFIFLVLLTYASNESIGQRDPTRYHGVQSYLRMVCEIIVGLTLFGVLFGEVLEMFEHRSVECFSASMTWMSNLKLIISWKRSRVKFWKKEKKKRACMHKTCVKMLKSAFHLLEGTQHGLTKAYSIIDIHVVMHCPCVACACVGGCLCVFVWVCVCVCVCHNEKKCQTNGKHDIDDTSSKLQQAQRKENYNKRKNSGRLRHVQLSWTGDFGFWRFHSSLPRQIYRTSSPWQAKVP